MTDSLEKIPDQMFRTIIGHVDNCAMFTLFLLRVQSNHLHMLSDKVIKISCLLGHFFSLAS